MTTRICKFGCGCLLSGFDEQARKYIEAGTGGLHTKERCEEAKAKLEQKNDHGNEQVQDTTQVKEYVDHTLAAKGQSKVKIFEDEDRQVVEEEYNAFLAANKIKTQGAQFQIGGGVFAIALYYEETRQ